MEISPGLLEVMDIVDEKDVIELIKHAVAEEIIFKPDSTDDSETEIEEIIEIIEEIDESKDLLPDYSKTEELVKEIKISDNTNFEENLQNQQCDRNSGIEEVYISDEENVMFKIENDKVPKSLYNEQQKSNNKVITYDADEDWQDEDVEHLEEIDEVMNHESDSHTESSQNYNFLHENERSGGNQGKNFPLQSHKTDIRNILESTTKVDKSQLNKGYGNDMHNIKNIDNNFTHEVIKNTENNLIYTVLGSRKPTKQLEEKKYTDAHYIKMEQLSENTIPVEGTIYYEGENMETLYVAQAVNEHEQYQYDAVPIEQNEQTWDTANEDRNSENDVNQYQEEENSQDQIFLHEDEDGQLYFKDDHGELQPVYLTEDGNYAIADNSDDQDSKESHNQMQQNNRISEEASMDLTESKAIIPKNKQNTVSSSSTIQDLDNEDNTVTISLIISEDEHGQKRTQVIIPTTDNMKCDICNKSFKTSFQLLRHNRLKHAREEDITTRNFPCDLCPKRYPDQNSLARHRKTHTGDRPFQCLECHKTFPTSTALRRHLTLHNSQSRPLPCIYCGRRFVEKASLMKHEQSHLPNDQRTHTCDVCQKTFLHATDLSLHKKYHDPDKKFDCEVCGREFNRLNNLQRHMMVHQQQGANEEILSCDVCGITYKFMSSLTRHMVTTHMNPEKLRQQAEEQRRKRENNYRRYLENRKMYETQHTGGYISKRNYHHNARMLSGNNEEVA
ncbi:zinc finger protein 836-like [Vespa crabro]|uniref:zinc finger protein 836-like n=1 Tax=Vespa crabro TaxID=7445 RepID=UPI001F026DB3|nr:zinc finger protein 836-like [Vespa crabro]XP_046822003.1 zinc finger protein 836-like [Vespa crabro]XP_046822004.1 zinc finger protein 836-like [Vespa crabro]XP_046822005.1 zinc finger protein 836-like [Vespa crabro]XP_046822006.1 zinc finger protein 836-like [Vespa crabro]